ncbi:Arm DNA-binding domain-containing protein [Sphingobium abikonense]|uniref:Arm DNA-binding domain-containing protein n=1 Tax=Sphingobium abikonense TaxID=86193 RepID=UPI00351266CE
MYLLVNPRGSKLWRIKYRIDGVERKLSLGAYPEITLAGRALPGMPPVGSWLMRSIPT